MFGFYKTNFAVLVALTAVLVLAAPAEAARPWKPAPQTEASSTKSPQEQAQDYVHIMDGRSSDEFVSVQWLVPPAMSNSPELKTLLDKYVIVGVAHFFMSKTATAQPSPATTLEAQDGKGNRLTSVPEEKLPADILIFIDKLNDRIRNAPGPTEQELAQMPDGAARVIALMRGAMRFFVFENGGVHACEKGRLVIPYEGENYTFDTPIPGCPKP